MRISEGQKAQLIIGDKVPIPTTTFNTGTTVGGNIVPVTSFQYQDVGIKIDVEPRVHHNKEVTMKLTVEASNLNGSVEIQAGQKQPIIGTRTITSNIRLKDGETSFLAGLLRHDKQQTTTSVPFLGDIPIIGRLFTDRSTDVKSQDLMLTLTPHIIRIPDISEEDLEPVYVGTDSNISYQGSPRIESPAVSGPFDFQRRQPPPVRAPVTQPAGPVPQNLTPDAFHPAPPPPTPQPEVPQTEIRPPGESASLESTAASAPVSTESAPASETVFSFEPAVVSVARGQQVKLLLRGRRGHPDDRIDRRHVRPVAWRPSLTRERFSALTVSPTRTSSAGGWSSSFRRARPSGAPGRSRRSRSSGWRRAGRFSRWKARAPGASAAVEVK